MKKIIKNICLCLSCLLILNSCESVDFEDTNKDPNNPTQAIPSQLLTQAQKYVGGTENNSDSNDNTTGVVSTRAGLLYVQHLTEGQYPNLSRYAVSEFSYNSWYRNPLMNLNRIIEVNTDASLASINKAYGSNKNQIAVAKLLRAYILNYMTDSWGYLPLSEAFKGYNDGKVAKFDSQEEIYNAIFANIDEALTGMDNGKGPTGDIMFGGDMGKWKTFGNTMKLIFALRISDANPTLAKTKFEEAVASGHLISSNGNNLTFNYGNTEGSDNPWEDRFESREDYILSETLVEKLRSNLDPRLFKFAQASRTGESTIVRFPNDADKKYVGGPNGEVNGDVPKYSLPTKTVIDKKDYKAPIYTLAQVKFSLAEAALKGWNVGGATPETLFKEGVKASLKQWGVSDKGVTDYIATRTNYKIEDIAYEKWVALFLQGHEAWAEWRRLDFPKLTPSKNATVQKIPVRFSYSSSVVDNNKENYNKMLKEQGEDSNHTKLWWDKN